VGIQKRGESFRSTTGVCCCNLAAAENKLKVMLLLQPQFPSALNCEIAMLPLKRQVTLQNLTTCRKKEDSQ
jgi:hypothetical protein